MTFNNSVFNNFGQSISMLVFEFYFDEKMAAMAAILLDLQDNVMYLIFDLRLNFQK